MNLDSKILVAGAKGMVGSAIVRSLKSKGFSQIIEASRSEVDFTNQSGTYNYIEEHQPEHVFVASAKVGGILANRDKKADFLTQNIQIQTNIIHGSFLSGVKKLLFLGSSCIYPKFAKQPITEDQLLTGPLEPTNDAYAISKICGIKMCQAYKEQYGFNAISLMPTNLYGINDNFDTYSSHVMPALIRKIHYAKTEGTPVSCWGDGSAMREFLYVDDLAEACLLAMNKYEENEIMNVGCGEDVSIKSLVEKICGVIGYKGEVLWDVSKPNGTPKKVLDVTKITKLGWKPKVSLDEGIKLTYQWYVNKVR